MYFQANPLFFDANISQITSASGSTLYVPTTSTPPPTTPPPTLQTNLIWGNFYASAISGTLTYVLSQAHITAATQFYAVQVINTANIISNNATSQLGNLVRVGICVQLTQASDCVVSANQALTVWMNTYQQTGNPVTENPMIPWIQTYDLVRGALPNWPNVTNVSAFDNFTTYFIIMGDLWVDVYPDNYKTNRLYIRTFASLTLGSPFYINTTMALLAAHAAQNLYSNGTCWDFMYRDALKYQVQNLQWWVNIVDQASTLLSYTTLRLIEANVNFLQPYVQGTLVHYEFANSSDPADASLKANPQPWVPSTSWGMLQYAEIVFPSVYNWTSVTPITRFVYSQTVLEIGALQNYYAQFPLFPPGVPTTVTTGTTQSATPSTSGGSTSSTSALATTSSPASTSAPATTSSPASTSAPATTSSPASTSALATTSSPASTSALATTSSPVSTSALAATSSPASTSALATTSPPVSTSAPASTSSPASTSPGTTNNLTGFTTTSTGSPANFTLLALPQAFEPAGDSNYYLVALGIIVPAAAYAALCGLNLAHRAPQHAPKYHRRHRRVRGEYDDDVIDLDDRWGPDQLRVPISWLI